MKNRKKRKRFNIGLLYKGRKQPLTARKKRSKTIKALLREGKIKIWNKNKHLTKKHKENLSISNRQAWKSQKLKEKMSKIKKKQWEETRKNPKKIEKIKKKIDKAVTKWWKEHPNIKKQKSQELKAFFIKHPEDFKNKFMNTKNNPFKPHIQTEMNVKVRSQGEKTIANCLNKNKIKAQYESKTLLLDGYICVPDFYIPKQKTQENKTISKISKSYYVEFYGGYPGSRKKKIIKNKLYKKHKAPVISITPCELTNLDYYLVREIRGVGMK